MLWPGQFVTATLTLDTIQNAVVAPAEAVQSGQQGYFVYAVKPDNHVEIRPVTMGRTWGGKVVIASGLRPGETVVTDGQIAHLPRRQDCAGGSSQAGNGAAVNLSRIFIDRPIMTTLVCFAILLFGAVAFRALPVAALPSVDYPTIQVNAALPGASPETMASSVATPLEREFSTIAGIQSMNSVNSQSSTQITVQFTLDRTIDAAAQDIQAHIAAAGGRLPATMPRPPSYQKVNPAEQPVFYLALVSDTLPLYTVTDYADVLLAQRISMVSGVARVQVYGEQKYAVRVQVDPDKLAAHNIGIDEVQAAIASSNTNLPTGRLDGAKQAFTIESSGGLLNAAAYRPIIVAWRGGAPGAPRPDRQRGRWRRRRQADRLVQQPARRDPGRQPPAGHQHRGSGRQHQAAAAGIRKGNPPGRETFGCL